jgi:predicted homoserine dehydrogenase-like protein
MNLHTLLLEREAAGKPVTVGLIGAGKFGTMFLAQARHTRGLHVVAVADLDVERARSQLTMAGWPAEAFAAPTLAEAHRRGALHVTDDADQLMAFGGIEVVVDATGAPTPASGTRSGQLRTASTSSWSTSRPTRSRVPCWRRRRARRAWSTASPGAISRR